MKQLLIVLDGLTWHGLALGCWRHGHALLCDLDGGHVCVRCKRVYAAPRVPLLGPNGLP
jgi:hypothetical protein